MKSSNSPALLCLITILTLAFSIAPTASGSLQTKKNSSKPANPSPAVATTTDVATDEALELLRQAVRELDGKGQLQELRDIFLLQMKHRCVSDAVQTMNSMMMDPVNEDALFSGTQSVYYGAKNYLVEYPDLVRLMRHPMLGVTKKQRDYRLDSLYSSMIHVLVQTKHMDMAVDYAKSFSRDPSTIKPSDKFYNPLGYSLCSGWESICKRFLDDQKVDEVIAIAESFTDPQIRRKMLTPIAGSLKAVQDESKRERLLELYNEAIVDSPAKRHLVERDEISEAIKKGDYDTARFMLDSYGDFTSYAVLRNAVQLVEALYEAGEIEKSTELLKTICRSETGRMMDKEIAEALLRAELFDLAIDFFGPLRMTEDLMSPMSTQSHQPLCQMAIASLKEGDVDRATRLVNAIEEPCWKSGTYFALYKNAKGGYEIYRDEWYEDALQSAVLTKQVKRRDWRLYIVLRDRLPDSAQRMKQRLGMIESPRIKAQTLANWITAMISSKSSTQPEIDRLIQQVATWDRPSLEYVLNTFVENNDVGNAIKTAKLYQHKDEMSAYQFDELFKLIFAKTSMDEVLRIIDAQTPQHRGRIMSYALRHVPGTSKKEFAAEVVERLDRNHIDLWVTNQLIDLYVDWGDLKSVRSILNLDLPENQFLYDDPGYNAWSTTAAKFAEKNGAKATIQFAESLTAQRARAITYQLGIAKLLSENPSEEASQQTLRNVKQHPDPILRGFGLLKIAQRMMGAKK